MRTTTGATSQGDEAPSRPDAPAPGSARFAGVAARGVLEHVDLATPEGLARLDGAGLWFVVLGFEGQGRAWRFAERLPAVSHGVTSHGVTSHGLTSDDVPERMNDGAGGAEVAAAVGAAPDAGPGWAGPAPDAWTSSADERAYRAGVERVRDHVREGDVYQVNLCRVLAAPLGPQGRAPDAGPGAEPGAEPSAQALADVLAGGNPAPYGGYVHVPAGSGVEPVWVVSASPELFLRRDGATLTSAPIKGTAAHAAGLLPKDEAENIMITDLVRNDLQHVCDPGTVRVDRLLDVEEHPGLVHLVSTVSGTLRYGVTWADVLGATFPPASVSGAPKSSALRIIDELEPVERGPYCGAVGWVDADAGTAELAVGIRTFWWRDGVLRFGTGAGITWGSDPEGEWRETELKAARLVRLASS